MDKRFWKPMRRHGGSRQWRGSTSVSALHIRRNSGRQPAAMPVPTKRGFPKKVLKSSALRCGRQKRKQPFWRVCFPWICPGGNMCREGVRFLLCRSVCTAKLHVSERGADSCLQMPKKRTKHGKILTKTYETVITIHKGETM